MPWPFAPRRGLMPPIQEESLKAMGGEIGDLRMQGLSIKRHEQSLADVLERRRANCPDRFSSGCHGFAKTAMNASTSGERLGMVPGCAASGAAGAHGSPAGARLAFLYREL